MNIKDPVKDTVLNLSKALLVAEMATSDTLKEKVKWMIPAVSEEVLDKITTKAINTYTDDLKWGRNTVIFKDDWEQMNKALGVKKGPEWMYGADFTPSIASSLGSLWKNVWSELEKNERRSEQEAEMVKNQIKRNKNLSKQAQKEIQKKGKAAIEIDERW